jgi:hypothetical protein
MNGWLLVRIAGIIVGIATLLRLATNEGLVTYDPLFLAWMDWLSDILELGLLTDVVHLLLKLAIDWAREFGWQLPHLQEVWRSVFVLSMLLLGAKMRHGQVWGRTLSAPVLGLFSAAYAGLTGDLASGVALGLSFTVAGAFIVSTALALAGSLAVVFGTGSIAVVISLASTSIFAFVNANIGERAGYLDVALPICLAIVFGVGAFIGAGAYTGISAVVVVAVYFLLLGTAENWQEGLDKVQTDPNFKIGIDILGVMLGALGLASWFANPPIW